MLRSSLNFAQCVSLPECFAFLNNLTFFLARRLIFVFAQGFVYFVDESLDGTCFWISVCKKYLNVDQLSSMLFNSFVINQLTAFIASILILTISTFFQRRISLFVGRKRSGLILISARIMS